MGRFHLICDIYSLQQYYAINVQERERALSLFEEGAPSLAATSKQVTVKGPDYNELVITVNKCCGLIPNTSGIPM